jgi:quercetin dioxygenase-like cupin family protein
LTSAPRRVVTGHDAAGKAVFLSDGPAPVSFREDDAGVDFFEVWNTVGTPAPVAPSEDGEPTERVLEIGPPARGSMIRVNEFAPGHIRDGRQSPVHRTETVDYGVVLEGEIVLLLDDSEVTLRAGDIVVQRGTVHAWANRSDRIARVAFILVAGEFTPELRASLGLDQG